MVDLSSLKLAWHDHRTDIPHWLASGIGRVAVEWSALERELEELIRLLLDGDIKDVRIVVNKMNAATRNEVATNLVQARVIDAKLQAKYLKDIGGLVSEGLQGKRDVLVHGMWDKYEGQWCVLRTRNLRPTPQLQPDIKKLSRAVLPQRLLVTNDTLAATAREIAGVSASVVQFCERLKRELSALRNTPPKYTRRKHDYCRKTRMKAR